MPLSEASSLSRQQEAEGWGHQNIDLKTLRLRGGCDADEPFDQSKYFASDKTQNPLTSSAAFVFNKASSYLVNLPSYPEAYM